MIRFTINFIEDKVTFDVVVLLLTRYRYPIESSLAVGRCVGVLFATINSEYYFWNLSQFLLPLQLWLFLMLALDSTYLGMIRRLANDRIFLSTLFDFSLVKARSQAHRPFDFSASQRLLAKALELLVSSEVIVSVAI